MIAWAAIIIWAILIIAFFRTMTVQLAFCVSIIGGYLLLPTQTGLDLPVLPELDKATVPALMSLLMAFAVLSDRKEVSGVLPGWLPRSRIVLAFLALAVFGAIGTAFTNGDPLFYGRTYLPAMSLYDGFSMMLGAIMPLIPFVLARKLLSTEEGLRVLLTVIVIGGVGYSVLAMYEARMSPQLSNTIYGVFPHSFMQHVRGGGYRPIIFLTHGLMVGVFLLVAVIAAFGLFRTARENRRAGFFLVGMFVLGSLVISKNLGALMLAVVALGLLFLLTERMRALVIAGIAFLVLLYPVLRSGDLLPLDGISSLARSINPERADSFDYRVFHEGRLLERAKERPVFGWGVHGRNRVYDEWGNDISTTDGGWIIMLGLGGWVYYIGSLGLLSIGAIALIRGAGNGQSAMSVIAGLALAVNLVDLIPNSGVSPVTWLLAGALVGAMERRAMGTSAEPEPEAVGMKRSGTRKTRRAGQARKGKMLAYTRFERGSGVDS